MKDKIVRHLNREALYMMKHSLGKDKPVDGMLTIKVNPIKGLFINTGKLCKEVNNDLFDSSLVVSDIIISFSKMVIFYSYQYTGT